MEQNLLSAKLYKIDIQRCEFFGSIFEYFTHLK
jgi:hypothetical protein